MALGLAYAGTAKEDVRELLLPLISVDETNVELVAQAALALGIVFAGTCDGASLPCPASAHDIASLQGFFSGVENLHMCIHAGDITEAIVQWLLLAENAKLEHAFAKFVALGLGFLFLGQQ